MNLLRHTGARLLQFLLVLFLGSVAVWAMIFTAPGSPVNAIVGADAPQEQRDAVAHSLGLDQPAVMQYLFWLARAAGGNLGSSISSSIPVTQLLGERLPATFQLIAVTFVIGLLIAVPLGTLSAFRPRGILAKAANVYQTTCLAMPSFWLGILLLQLLGLNLHLLPTVAEYIPFFENPLDALRNILLPALTLGLFMAAVLMRFVRAAVADTLGQPYVLAAVARGASPMRVAFRHGLRNALVPIVTVVGLQIGAFIGGTIITEAVFNYPGLGRLILDAVSKRDYPVIQGAILVVIASFAIINMLVDMIYVILDPRVRLK